MKTTRYCNHPIGTVGIMAGVWAVPVDFAWSFAMMVQHNAEAMCEPGKYVHYARATMSYHSFARNFLAQSFLGDWLLMLDTDHVFDPDIAVRMVHRMEAIDADVLTGVYQYKSPPHGPVVYTKVEGEERGYAPITDWKVPEGGLIRVYSAGGGCLLVRRRVFDRIEKELGEQPFMERDGMSEDHSFFKRLELLGISAFCDFRIQSPHLTTRTITLDDYDRVGIASGDFVLTDGIGIGAN